MFLQILSDLACYGRKLRVTWKLEHRCSYTIKCSRSTQPCMACWGIREHFWHGFLSLAYWHLTVDVRRANVLSATFLRGPVRWTLITSSAFLISESVTRARVRSLLPYLSQRHRRTEIGKQEKTCPGVCSTRFTVLLVDGLTVEKMLLSMCNILLTAGKHYISKHNTSKKLCLLA